MSSEWPCVMRVVSAKVLVGRWVEMLRGVMLAEGGTWRKLGEKCHRCGRDVRIGDGQVGGRV